MNCIHFLSQKNRNNNNDNNIPVELAGLGHAPSEALVPEGQRGGHSERRHCLEAELLACVLGRVRRPGQENSHILGQLRLRVGGSVRVVDLAVIDRRRHGDGAAREVRVVVLTLHDGHTSRRVSVAGQQSKQVVGAAVTSLYK